MYFLSPPLLKLKPVEKWKEVVIINSLPHTQKDQSSPLDKQTERERKCVCVCVTVCMNTHTYMVTTGFSLFKLFALRLEHSDPGKMTQLISGKE